MPNWQDCLWASLGPPRYPGLLKDWWLVFCAMISTDISCMQDIAQTTTFFAAKICDFCNKGSFIKAYACHAFVYLKGTPMEHYRYEEWTACEDCARLIDAEQWNALAERTVQAFTTQHRTVTSDVPILREHVKNLHQAFRQNLIPEA